jgi:hypothetical protein
MTSDEHFFRRESPIWLQARRFFLQRVGSSCSEALFVKLYTKPFLQSRKNSRSAIREYAAGALLPYLEKSIIARDTPDSVSYHDREQTPVVCFRCGRRGVLRCRGSCNRYPIFAPLVS